MLYIHLHEATKPSNHTVKTLAPRTDENAHLTIKAPLKVKIHMRIDRCRMRA